LSRLVRESEFQGRTHREGADEVFAGYNIFKEDRIRQILGKAAGIKNAAGASGPPLSLYFFDSQRSSAISGILFKKRIF
jgi:asparagine synthetase B (glutamine-hydrolysing)